MSETVSILKPYNIKGDNLTITITGFEEEQLIDSSELNVTYNYVNNVKTQAQVQNMLFFGNVDSDVPKTKELQNLSYFIEVSLNQSNESIGWIDENYEVKLDDNLTQTEYYNPQNIYYKVGYWPDEIYRLGVVYIMNDDSLSPVFNLRGCEFKELNESNLHKPYIDLYDDSGKINYIDKDEFIFNGQYLDNTMGVFKNPVISQNRVVQNYQDKTTKP